MRISDWSSDVCSSDLFEGGAERISSAADHLDDFERDTACVLDMIEGVMPEAAWLSDGETLNYLHTTISTHNQRIAVPETPMPLARFPEGEKQLLAALGFGPTRHRPDAEAIRHLHNRHTLQQ